jgi:phosphoribosylformimino-5-aminoimidazole carboxamide ribotide isomerase
MLIIPAIDLKDGKVVRLTRGEFSQEKVYSLDPVAVAKEFVAQGAKRIHLVDLQGALKGELKNLKSVEQIARAVKVPIEFGGGVRKLEDIANILSLGISCVVLGTKALDDPTFVAEAVEKFKDKIAVSIDAKRGALMQQGWTKDSDKNLVDFIRKMENFGLRLLIYTDISRDGTLEGPNIDGIRNILNLTKIPVIASGGISGPEDIKSLQKLEENGLFGVIIGKAIYENKINLKEVIKSC